MLRASLRSQRSPEMVCPVGLSFPTQGIAADGMTSLKAWVRMLAPRHPLFEAICRKLRRSSAAVATSREGHRSPRSGRAVQHRRWDRGRLTPVSEKAALNVGPLRWSQRCRCRPAASQGPTFISCPALKIGEAAGKAFPVAQSASLPRAKKISRLGNFHLRDEEVVTRRQIKRRCKVH